jgi:hypothetical protein
MKTRKNAFGVLHTPEEFTAHIWVEGKLRAEKCFGHLPTRFQKLRDVAEYARKWAIENTRLLATEACEVDVAVDVSDNYTTFKLERNA